MRQSYLKFSVKGIGFLLAFLVFSSSGVFAALSGSSYTINKGASASSTNYQSFASFVSDMVSGTRADLGTANGPNVSGPVVVSVVASSGPYTEQITITAITGASATNTITINGNGNTIQFTATAAATAHVIELNGADWFRFDNLVVLANGTSIGRCFHLRESADNNIISNCEMRMPNMNLSTSSYNAYVVLSNGTSSPQTYGDAGENNQILKNKLNSGVNKGPYAGIVVMDESSGSNVHANSIIGNEIKNWYYAGIWTYYAFQQTIKHNEIHNTGSTSNSAGYGMYNYNYNKGGDYIIDSNYIHDLGPKSSTVYWYMIYHYAYYGTGTAKTISISGNRLIMDNEYYGYGVYAYGIYNVWTGDILFNNNYIKASQTNTTYYHQLGYNYMAYYAYYANKITIVGNYLENTANASSVYGLYSYVYYATPKEDIMVANNIVYMKGGTYQYYGLFVAGYGSSKPFLFLYNTVYFVDWSPSVATQYRYYMYYTYGCSGDFKNNITYTNGTSGTSIVLYGYYSVFNFDRNDWSLPSGPTYQFIYGATGTTYNDLASFYAGAGIKTDFEVDPKFKNPAAGDFTPTNFNMVNKGAPVVIKDDFYKKTRNATNPDVGAVEFFIDVAISNFTMSSGNKCGGHTENVTVTITNNNTDAISGVPLAYDINGQRKNSEMVTATIAGNSSTTFTFKKPAEFNFPGTNTINVYLDGSDDVTTNNLVSSTLFIVNSPYGGTLAEGASFPGYFKAGGAGGVMTNPDVTIPGAAIEYDIVNPTNHATADYGSGGTKWDMTKICRTVNGTPVSGLTYVAPSGSNLGKLTFDPPSSFQDSLIYVGVMAHSYATGCDTTFGRYVYVPQVPNVDFSFPSAVCDGTPLEFKNNSNLSKGSMMTGRMGYFWDFDDAFSNPNTSDLSDPIYTFSSYGVYNVSLKITIPEFPKFDFIKTKQVVVASKPLISFKVLNACEGEALKFENATKLPAGVPGTISYDWDFGDKTPHNLVDYSPSHKYTKAGGYKVTLVASSSGCVATLEKNANQFARPKAAFSKTGTCNVENIMFTNKSTIALGNTGYKWDFNDGSISNLENPSHVFATHGSKTVKLMAISEFGCKDSSTLAFTLNESPKADFTHSDPCNLTATQFTRTGTIPGGAVSSIYEWNFNGEGVSTNQNPGFKFSSQGLKDVTLVVRSDNGCADAITHTFNVKLQAKAAFTVKDVCEGEAVAFTNKSSVAQGELIYEWRFGNGQTSQKTSPKQDYGTIGTTKTFLVTLVANVPGGCSDSTTMPVTVNAKTNPAFNISKQGRTITCTPVETDPTLIRNWRFGEGSRSTDAAPVHTYSNVDKGTFQVCLGVINTANCLSEACKEVTIDLVGIDEVSASKIQVYPNPSNGRVTVTIDNVQPSVKITVFNLLGEAVFQTEPTTRNGVYSLDLSNYSNGVYVVQVKNGETISSQKITLTK